MCVREGDEIFEWVEEAGGERRRGSSSFTTEMGLKTNGQALEVLPDCPGSQTYQTLKFF